LAQKVEKDKLVDEYKVKVAELLKKRDAKAMLLGNIVDKNNANTEVCTVAGDSR
jgi:hypothetical protein